MRKKVFNVMFSKRLGGIEQSFLDYNEALAKKYEVVSLISNKSQVKQQLKTPIEEITQFNKYDPFAIMKIRYVIKKHRPHLIIAHSTRAYVLCKLATKSVPIIAVSHNHNYRHLLSSKYLVTITSGMKDELVKLGKKHVFALPNMIHFDSKIKYLTPNFKKTITIGFIGTLTYIKGVDVLIKAIGNLIKKDIIVKLQIAGDGEELENLKLLARKLNIFEQISFLGWVKGTSKTKFFKNIDILCVPSRHEPFGIVLLEAMKYSKPIVTTKTHGALEVAKDIAVFCECDDDKSLSDSLQQIVANPILAKELSKKGFKEVAKYSVEKISQKLHDIVERVITENEDI